MFYSYLKLAFRHLMKARTNTTINILGLSLGMAVALLAGLWVWDELSFDRVHTNHERLAQILSVFNFNGSVGASPIASVPMAAALKEQDPADFKYLSLLSATDQTLANGDKKIGGSGAWVQADFPVMFSLGLIEGTANALKDPASMLLSAGLAKALFGSTPAIGKVIRLGSGTTLKVGGIYKDLPQNSSFYGYAFLLPWDNNANPGKQLADGWSNHHFQLFVQLAPHADADQVSARIKDLAKPHFENGSEELQLYPMDRWRLYDRSENGHMTGGRLQQVWLCGIIAVFVLLLGCINFINLSTARSAKRARETGVRKVLGSSRRGLAAQFLGEALLMTFLATLAAVLLTQVTLPWFNELSGKDMSIPYSSPLCWLLVLAFSTFIGLLSGSYPAFYLSGFQAIEVLKGRLQTGNAAFLIRRILVIVQFTVSISLIISVITIYRQVQFAKNRPVGYTSAGLITIEPGMQDLLVRFDALREDLLKTGAIQEVAESSSPTTEVRNTMLGYDWEGRDPRTFPALGTLFISHEFGRTIGWTIKEGRDFSRAFATDSGAFIVNEAAAKYMGMKNPVGQSIRLGDTEHPIIGVIQDMVMESPYSAITPTVFTATTNPRIHTLILRINPAMDIQTAVARIKPIMMRYDPETVFSYQFVDTSYGSKFVDEERTTSLTAVFAVLAIVISCMGLFGLVSFVAEQRTREIGIRKVLGASVFKLWRLLSAEFVVLVLVSGLIAGPLTGFFLHAWLLHFSYHTPLSWWIFLLASAGALFITLLTVSHQTIRAASANPINSLRSEG
jgi:putative ABC transport system permease protein